MWVLATISEQCGVFSKGPQEMVPCSEIVALREVQRGIGRLARENGGLRLFAGVLEALERRLNAAPAPLKAGVTRLWAFRGGARVD